MGRLICSAASLENLQKLINNYYCSENYIITDDFRAYNTKLKRYSDNRIVFKKGRWRFETNN